MSFKASSTTLHQEEPRRRRNALAVLAVLVVTTAVVKAMDSVPIMAVALRNIALQTNTVFAIFVGTRTQLSASSLWRLRGGRIISSPPLSSSPSSPTHSRWALRLRQWTRHSSHHNEQGRQHPRYRYLQTDVAASSSSTSSSEVLTASYSATSSSMVQPHILSTPFTVTYDYGEDGTPTEEHYALAGEITVDYLNEFVRSRLDFDGTELDSIPFTVIGTDNGLISFQGEAFLEASDSSGSDSQPSGISRDKLDELIQTALTQPASETLLLMLQSALPPDNPFAASTSVVYTSALANEPSTPTTTTSLESFSSIDQEESQEVAPASTPQNEGESITSGGLFIGAIIGAAALGFLIGALLSYRLRQERPDPPSSSRKKNKQLLEEETPLDKDQEKSTISKWCWDQPCEQNALVVVANVQENQSCHDDHGQQDNIVNEHGATTEEELSKSLPSVMLSASSSSLASVERYSSDMQRPSSQKSGSWPIVQDTGEVEIEFFSMEQQQEQQQEEEESRSRFSKESSYNRRRVKGRPDPPVHSFQIEDETGDVEIEFHHVKRRSRHHGSSSSKKKNSERRHRRKERTNEEEEDPLFQRPFMMEL